MKEELLFAKYLETHAKGESIFRVIEQFFNDNKIPLINIFAWATDGVKAMIGCNIGFFGLIKKTTKYYYCSLHHTSSTSSC